MKYLFYTTSESAWEGLYKAMQSSKESIYMEMYIFIDDTAKANEFISLLAEKAKSGVRVRVVLDWFGSYSLSKEAQSKLDGSGVELLFFKKLLRRLHHKIVIVDEKIGFLGGVNIHKGARLWDDLLVRLEGPVVNSMTKAFGRIYKHCGGRDSKIGFKKKKAIFGATQIWLFEHIPYLRKRRLRALYTEAVMGAKNRVIFVTPYFTPSKWLIQLLREAISREIRVEVIVPVSTDVALLSRANRRYINMLAESGVIFFLMPRMNHAKLLLVDEDQVLLGSANLDALSFEYNAEVGIIATDPKMIADISQIINSWKAQSINFLAPMKVTIIDRLLSILVRLLQPFL